MKDHSITRREALKRTSMLVGGALSAASIPGVLVGCDAAPNVEVGTEAVAAWVPRTLSVEQSEMVALIGEHILPETDTPGARAARVHQHIDAMLTDFYPPDQRIWFIEGLARADQRARRAFGRSFLEAAPQQQAELVEALNRAAYSDPQVRPEGGHEEAPILQEGEAATSRSFGGGAAGASAAPTALLYDAWDPGDRGRQSFFRTLKDLVLEGYYTSEMGATQELGVNPMGIWRADMPYAEVGHTWA